MTALLNRDGVSLSAQDGVLYVAGDVDFGVAAPLAERGGAWLAERPAGARVVLDLAGVERVSSAALSVLLEWTRRARAAELRIDEVRLSVALARLTDVAGLAALLPLAPADA